MVHLRQRRSDSLTGNSLPPLRDPPALFFSLSLWQPVELLTANQRGVREEEGVVVDVVDVVEDVVDDREVREEIRHRRRRQRWRLRLEL